MKETTTGRSLTQRSLLIALATGAFAALGLDGASAAQAPEPVQIDSGLISGEVLGASIGLQAFRGIPFAAPPVGDLRWRPPQDVAPWDGVRECVEFGPVAPQSPGLTGLVGDPLPPTDEDCLYLNIWTTKTGIAAKQPVMVWIHGGGFNVGWSNQTAYEGSELAKRGVVIVTINYRLGALGFLAHPALSAESKRNVSGNYGMLDCIAALKWVQRNIAAFGGDAGNVTIFGESAGGTAVAALCASPLAKGIVHRGIAQSPGGTNTYLRNSPDESRSAEESGEAWAARVVGDETDDVLAALRAIPANDLLNTGAPATIVADGWFMNDITENEFANGNQNDIPIIAGTNTDEGTIFVGSYPWRTVEAYQNGMKEQFGDGVAAALKLYPVSKDEDILGALNVFIADTWFLRPATGMLRGMDKVSSNAYQYVFTHRSQRTPERGAYHSSEMYYPFNTLHPADEKSENPELAEAIIQYWVQFAKTGNPNVDGLPAWPEYETDSAQYLELGEEIKTGTAYRHEAMEILNRIR